MVTALLLTFETFRNQKYMRIMFWISCASFLLVQLLQVTGITFYIKLVPIVHVLILFIIAGILFNYIQSKRHRREMKDIYIYKALIALSCFAVGDIILFYLFPAMHVGTLTKVGLLFFIVYLAYTGLKQFYQMEMEAAKTEVYHELAVKDLMTGLANRTAFEQEMSRLRESLSAQTGTLHFFFADVNNLKTINDQYGHSQGDDCIIKTARALTECFLAPCTCYRIGGDEFCVICKGFTEEELNERTKQLQFLISQYDAETIYPFCVACGHHVIDKDGVDECLKKADALMYEQKAMIKAGRTTT